MASAGCFRRSTLSWNESLPCSSRSSKTSKRTPQEREEFRRLIESGRAARENMQNILDRHEAQRRAEEERRERRRKRLHRLMPFRRLF
jgi:hypothetical protein